jgi:hypothetical protein
MLPCYFKFNLPIFKISKNFFGLELNSDIFSEIIICLFQLCISHIKIKEYIRTYNLFRKIMVNTKK